MDIQERILERIDKMYEVNVELMNAFKRLGDSNTTQIAHLGQETQRLYSMIHDAAESRKEIYGRLEKLERACAARHGLLNERRAGGQSFDSQAQAFLQSKLGPAVLWAAMIGIGALIAELAERIL